MSYRHGCEVGRLAAEDSASKTRHWLQSNIALVKFEIAQLEASRAVELDWKRRRLELMERQYDELLNQWGDLPAKP